MWTDKQLAQNGWSEEQIAQYRIEQEIAESPKENQIPDQTTESQLPNPVNLDTHATVGENKVLETADFADSKLMSTPSMFQDKTQTILIICMMIIAPLSVAGIFIGGPEGPAGESGEQGVNGEAGSSFHLVQNSDDLPICDESVDNQIFFVASDSGFEVCQNQTWSVINLTGLQGDPGMDGADGANGTDGVNGTNGTNGTNGIDGQNGADGNDGADGQDGTDGVDGSNGANGLTSLIVTSVEPNGANCPTGGTRIDTGIDDNGNSFLEIGEIDDTILVCNGEVGNDGANGSSTATMMVARLSIAPAYLGCNGTGQLLQQGLDDGSGGGIAQNGVLESGEIITSSLICTTFAVEQVEDINSGGSGSLPSNFCTINSTLYFTANNGSTGGIWSMDVNGNISLEYTGTAFGMRVIGNQLMFLGQDIHTFDVEPYVFDPSNGSAWRIADIFPGNSGSFAGEFTLIGTTVFFSARDSAGSTGMGLYDLWAYDTVNYGVWKVEADIQPTSLVVVNSDLYFSAQPQIGVTGIELWKHETATNTTFMVKDINPGTLSSNPSHLTVMGTSIYMSANSGTTYGTELYAYDTANNSTWLAADIRPGFAGSSPSELVILGTRVYLQATSGSHFEMWAYESSNNSFWEVTNIQSTSATGAPSELTVRGNTVFFSADDGTTGEELWAHNSINETTWQVIDLKPIGGYVGEIYVHDGNLYFAGEDNWTGIELWKLIFSRQVTFV